MLDMALSVLSISRKYKTRILAGNLLRKFLQFYTKLSAIIQCFVIPQSCLDLCMYDAVFIYKNFKILL